MIFVLILASANLVKCEELNIYSHRQPFLINPFLEEFTKKTGITTNVIYSTKGLAQRLRSEGKNSPADVVLTVDIGRLYIYQDMDLLSVINSKKLSENIPEHLRSLDNTWFGLSKRARIIVTSKDRVKVGAISRIEDLADPRWAGKICTRPGSHVYSRALMSSLIAAHGLEEAEKWATGLVSNLARSTDSKTLTVGLMDFTSQFTINWPGMCALAVFIIIPALILTFMVQKHLVSGLTFGGVKG